MQDMTKLLQVECQKGCGQLYTILQKERLDHEASCTEADLSTLLKPDLSNIFSMDENNPIPETFEKAALHVIRRKLSESTSPNN